MTSTLNLNGDFIAIASWEPGRTDVFVRGPTNSVLHKWQTAPDAAWLPGQWNDNWETLANNALSDITAVSWGPHRIDLFWIGEQNSVQHLFWNGTCWTLESLGGEAIGRIAAVSWGNNKLAVFHRGMGNTVFSNLWYEGKWHGWDNLGGEIVGIPVAVSWGENRVDVFHRSASLDVQQKSFDGTTLKWTDNWTSTEGVATLIDDIAAVSPSPGTINLFGIGTTNAVFVQTFSGGEWSHWTSLGGNNRSKPDAVAFQGSALAVAVQGHDNAAYVNFLQAQGETWSGWQQVGDKYNVTETPVFHPRSNFNLPIFIRNAVANLVILKNDSFLGSSNHVST
ncbi:fucose-specific lectin [Thozetella sp. PMI_491]|nr:fucose-specific lectin [Thozetella sp. PMI_491]